VFLGIDLANFYLNTPMADPEYMRLQLNIIPEEIIIKYNLRDLGDKDGWVYIEIRKGMYGLPQAGIIANQLLEKRLSEKRLLPVPTQSGPLASRLAQHRFLPCR